VAGKRGVGYLGPLCSGVVHGLLGDSFVWFKARRVLSSQLTEPTEMVNPLLEQAEHRDGKVFLHGNRVLINLNLTRNQITEQGLKAFLAAVESQQQSCKVGTGAKGHLGLLRLSLGKNKFPSESSTFAKIQELMVTRDPIAKLLEEEQAVAM
uniref:Uncharacterized protein n=1 Tax=Sphenodon punctatus TaxID=8508 RepID=A0A8D0G5N7_SPHPU